MNFLNKKILQLIDLLLQTMSNKFPEAKKHLIKARDSVILQNKNMKKVQNDAILKKRKDRDEKTKEWLLKLKEKKSQDL